VCPRSVRVCEVSACARRVRVRKSSRTKALGYHSQEILARIKNVLSLAPGTSIGPGPPWVLGPHRILGERSWEQYGPGTRGISTRLG
jgi:hypothetical protein